MDRARDSGGRLRGSGGGVLPSRAWLRSSRGGVGTSGGGVMESTAEPGPQAESGALWKRAKVSKGLACGSRVNPAARASSSTRLANPCSCSCRRSTRYLKPGRGPLGVLASSPQPGRSLPSPPLAHRANSTTRRPPGATVAPRSGLRRCTILRRGKGGPRLRLPGPERGVGLGDLAGGLRILGVRRRSWESEVWEPLSYPQAT